MSVALVALSLLLTASAFYGGISKLLGAGATRADAERLGFSRSAYVRIGALETSGGVGLALGLAAWPFGVAAAAGILCLVTGAVVAHLRAGDPPATALPAAVIGILDAVLIGLHLAVNA